MYQLYHVLQNYASTLLGFGKNNCEKVAFALEKKANMRYNIMYIYFYGGYL